MAKTAPCKQCPRTINPRGNKSGLCFECSKKAKAARLRRPDKFCGCGAKLGRWARYGACVSCANKHPNGQRTDANAARSLTVKGDTGVLLMRTPVNVQTLPQLIAVCEIDTEEWEVKEWVANAWQMGSVNRKTGDTQATQLFQIKAWLRRKVEVLFAKAEIEALRATIGKDFPPLPAVKRPHEKDTPYLLEISIFDHHFGKLAWGRETGYQNYDLNIAIELYRRAVANLLLRTAGYTFAKIVFVIGQDMLNADNKQNTTTRGTPQSTDGRYQKTFMRVRDLLIDTIANLRQLAPVEVVVVPGNHDSLAAWHLGDSLNAYFHATEDVTINNEPTPRKYVRHGKCLLGFTHGDKTKADKLPGIMLADKPRDVGETKFREIHVGHIHQTRLQEFHGIRVRTLSALCPVDAWHSEEGYVGQQRQAEAFVWHADEGIVSTAVYTEIPKETE